MPKAPTRPDHLPDFEKPPLNEVVLGVQFTPPRGYQQILAGEVWGLFKSDFPSVEELPAIPPSFETFGQSFSPQPNFGFITGALHDRFWFLSPKKDELIQFQNDRLLHNWRKIDDQTNQYPRFEKIIESFSAEILKLENYFLSLDDNRKINYNQAEVSYINHVPIDEKIKVSDWLNFLDFGNRNIDDISATIRRVLSDAGGKPWARLICEVNTAINQATQQRVIIFTLTVRGPVSPDRAAAIEFLERGRDIVVSEFTELTTNKAHKLWGRKK